MNGSVSRSACGKGGLTSVKMSTSKAQLTHITELIFLIGHSKTS